MTPREFKRWRTEIVRMKQTEAAVALGMSRTSIYKMEAGLQGIEKRTRLAMAALSMGLRDYEVP